MSPHPRLLLGLLSCSLSLTAACGDDGTPQTTWFSPQPPSSPSSSSSSSSSSTGTDDEESGADETSTWDPAGSCEQSWTDGWETSLVSEKGHYVHEQSQAYALAVHGSTVGVVHRDSSKFQGALLYRQMGPNGELSETIDTWPTDLDVRTPPLVFDDLGRPYVGVSMSGDSLSDPDDTHVLWRGPSGWESLGVDWWDVGLDLAPLHGVPGVDAVASRYHELEYHQWMGGEYWNSGVVLSYDLDLDVAQAQLAIGPDESRHIAYRLDVDEQTSEIHYATLDLDRHWVHEKVADAGTGTEVELVADADGLVHVGFLDPEGYATIASRLGDSAWAISHFGLGPASHFELHSADGEAVVIWAEGAASRWNVLTLYDDDLQVLDGPSLLPAIPRFAVTADQIYVLYFANHEPPLADICYAVHPR